MTRITRLAILSVATAAGVFLAPALSNEAVGQITITVPAINRSYYNGYSMHYRLGSGQPVYGYRGHAYTGYGTGPYGYGVANPYGYPSSGGYEYRSGRSYSTYYGGAYLRGGSYHSVYRPPTIRYYSPYGYGYQR